MKLIKVSPKSGFRLYLRYDDGVEGAIDLSSMVGKGVFSQWTRPGEFEQVKLAAAGHPEWPGGLDLCPDSLYLQLTGKTPRERFPLLSDRHSHA